MTIINLRNRKVVLENLISDLQVELDHINSELEVQEVTQMIQEAIPVAVDKTEEELLRECDTFSISSESIGIKRGKVAKGPKKEKLTKAQQEVMDAVYKAQAYYTYMYSEGSRYLREYVNGNMFIDGESINYVVAESGARLVYDKAYYFGNGEYGYRMSSNTLRALERKGYINVVEEVGDGLDIFTLVDEITAPEVYTEVTALEFVTTGKYPSNREYYCPIGQEAETLERVLSEYKNLTHTGSRIQKVNTWNGRARS